MASSESLELGPEYLPQKRLLSFLFPKKIHPIPADDEKKQYPEQHASFFSRLFFGWVIPNLNVGYSRTLTDNDLYELSDKYKVEYRINTFEHYFHKHLQIAHKKHPDKINEPLQGYSKLRIILVVFLTFKRELALSLSYAAFNSALLSIMPTISKGLTNAVEEKYTGSHNLGQGVGWAFGLAACVLFVTLSLNHLLVIAYNVGVQLRSILTDAVMRKSFRLSAASKKKYPDSRITSLISTDVNRIQGATLELHFVITAPIPLAVSLAFLLSNLHLAGLIGVACLVVFIAFTTYTATKLYSFRSNLSELTDARISLTSEVIHNLKMIKLYSWEVPYLTNVIKARSAEVKVVMSIQVVRNILEAFSLSLSSLSSMLTFIVVFAIDGVTKTAAVTFSSLTAFGILSDSIESVPRGLVQGADFVMGLKRLFEFLLTEEEEGTPPNHHYNKDDKNALTLKNAYFEWDRLTDGDGETFKFADLNLTVQKGEFVVISGPIGSGKSSLLNALNGTMKCTSGSVNTDGNLVFCDQPWVQNTTIRNNITFGKEFDQALYEEVVFACALQNDFDSFQGGDLTEVGERGITLSGGQKARINLARALYAEGDIILLDDVLSAVDAKVGKHIVRHCLLDFLQGRTIVLATHQLALAEFASRIIFINSDRTIDTGSKNDLAARNFQFKKLLSFSQQEEIEEEKEIKNEEIEEIEELASNKESKPDQKLLRRKPKINKKDELEEKEVAIIANDESKGKIIETESKAVNGIQYGVYKAYLKYGAEMSLFLYSVIFMSFLIITGFLSVFTNTWLSFWVNDKFHETGKFYIGLYVLLNIMMVLSIAGLFTLVALTCSKSSKNMNLAAIKKLLHSPMAFLDVTPIGRILNRFTKDTDSLDNEIADLYKYLVMSIWNLGGTIVLIMIYLPVIIAVLPFIFLGFLVLVNYYIASTREIKRMESVRRSFLFSNINESLGGMATIKNYRGQQRFIELNKKYLNYVNEATLLNYSNQCWLGLNIELISLVITLLVSILCVTQAFSISAASVGLLINYISTMASNASLFIRMYTRLQTAMNSAERIVEYADDLPQEAAYTIQATQPSAEWPSGGSICFKNVSMSYRPGLPMVLKNVNFTAGAGEKIGICGRTGAGKSSIMNALYRLSELSFGEITIDGINISKIGLKDLRSNLSIIPQDPVLFNGTIKSNLDPFGEYEDTKIWDALRRSGLITTEDLTKIQEQDPETDQLDKFHIQQEIANEGGNFSLGEKQLLALARALLRDTKILIMDEATSSVDYETDSKIQHTISTEFSHCTILCVAHRLKTIIKYDRILTLDRGEISAIDTPLNLFKLETSIFRQMCDKSGIVEKDFIQNLIEYDISDQNDV